MEYEGKLYGKVGRKYFPLINTTQDWDAMLEALHWAKAMGKNGKVFDKMTLNKINSAIKKAKQ